MPVHKSKPDRSNEWITVIQPKTSFIRINFKEIWQYRDLLRMFVKRDVITVYKQTILGPVWYIVQPILTTAIYMLIFGKIAKLSTDGMPQILFYLGGIVIWNYFAESFNTTSKTFIENANIFGKVYFPRLIMPLAKITSGLIKFLIQFSFFLAVYTYFLIGDHGLTPNWTLILVPLYILLMALIGLGTGILFTSMTTRYRFQLPAGIQDGHRWLFPLRMDWLPWRGSLTVYSSRPRFFR